MGQSASKEPISPKRNEEFVADNIDGSNAPVQSTSTAAESPPKQRQQDKVREGPCAQLFEDLEKCAGEKGVTKHAVSLH